LNYDCAFREHEATVKLTNWSAMNVPLLNYHQAGASHLGLRPLVTPPVKSFATHGMQVTASQ